MNLSEYLISKGYGAACLFPLDGQYHRFDHAGALSGWFKARKLHGVGTDKGFGVLAAFGDFKTGEAYEFKDMSSLGTAPETAEWIEAELARMKSDELADRRKLQEEVALDCERAWGAAITRGTTPYLERKGLKSLYGARICPDQPDTLMVPGRDINGKLWTIQRILPEKLSSGMDKLMKKGGRKQGCFHLMGEISPKGTIYVAEGFATAAAIYESLAPSTDAVASAFDVGNLAAVGAELRGRFPDLRIVFCADDDRYHGDDPRLNRGVRGAEAAAASVGGEVRVPRFVSYATKPTDFQDLMAFEGLAVVREQILTPLVTTGKPPEKKKRFSEKLVADWMLEWTGGKLVRQDKNLFRFDGAKWTELDSQGIDLLKNKINTLCGEALTSKDVGSCYNTFFRYVPAVPDGVNLFEPARDRINFRNGTLHVRFRPKTPEEVREKPGMGTHHFDLSFRPHNREDYCTTVIPHDYAPHAELAANSEYEAMLRNIWPDADYRGKVDFYEELLGTCLAPLFPKITFLVGQPGTGKSTLILLAAKLVGKDNASGCDLTLWGDSFGLEPMVNKLVNFDTDISTTRRIPDDLVKKIIDGRCSIRRKNKTNVEARLPAIHVFGANQMPTSLEGMSGAYNRRFVILKTDVVQPGQGGGGEFADWVWAQGPQGVLKAALRGLERLLARGGVYSPPDSSKEELRAWAKDNDHLQQFIEAIEHGEIRDGDKSEPWVVEPGARVPSQAFYTRFVKYVESVDAACYRAGRYPSLIFVGRKLRRDPRFTVERDKDKRYVSGCGVRGQEAGPY